MDAYLLCQKYKCPFLTSFLYKQQLLKAHENAKWMNHLKKKKNFLED